MNTKQRTLILVILIILASFLSLAWDGTDPGYKGVKPTQAYYLMSYPLPTDEPTRTPNAYPAPGQPTLPVWPTVTPRIILPTPHID